MTNPQGNIIAATSFDKPKLSTLKLATTDAKPARAI